ncbi:MAG: moderate conductance mechanosensitive channel [Actinomycetota bacterium]|nr:moderate conductance mechanosensitive channel [Actinomycetota bacterium]
MNDVTTWAAGMPAAVAMLLDIPLKILLILIGAFAVRVIVHRIVDRIAEGIAQGTAGLGRLDEKLPTATAILGTSPLLSARRQQRARTTGSILNSAATAVIGIVALLTVLPLFGVPNAPLLTSASILGVALGIGAQTLVKDILAGLFMIMEDQYGVGDLVDLGHAQGTVEGVGLRVTRLRDADGSLWYVRNGEIIRVGNHSQGWARAVLDVAVPPGEEIVRRTQAVLLDVARAVAADPVLTRDIIGEPQVWGVEGVAVDKVVIRLAVRTEPLRQWDVARALRARILERFEEEGLPTPVGLERPVAPAN